MAHLEVEGRRREDQARDGTGLPSPDEPPHRDRSRHAAERRDERRERGARLRHAAEGQRGRRHRPEEELGLVQVVSASDLGDQPSAVVEDVLGQERESRFVRRPEGAAPRGGGDEHRGKDQHAENRGARTPQAAAHRPSGYTIQGSGAGAAVVSARARLESGQEDHGGACVGELTGGQAVVELLKAEGVRYIFGIVGATFLDVLDALYDDRSVEYINVRHEQAGAFMADGLARVTGLPGVCLVTSGPGATNLLTGVAAAHVAHSPVVVLVGGISLEHSQKDAFQEFDLVRMFRPVTKLAVQIGKPDRIPELLRAALRTAMTGRRGPVFVEIPRDVLNDQVLNAAVRDPGTYRVIHAQPPHPDPIREAARPLRRGARSPLLAGRRRGGGGGRVAG